MYKSYNQFITLRNITISAEFNVTLKYTHNQLATVATTYTAHSNSTWINE